MANKYKWIKNLARYNYQKWYHLHSKKSITNKKYN